MTEKLEFTCQGLRIEGVEGNETTVVVPPREERVVNLIPTGNGEMKYALKAAFEIEEKEIDPN